MPGGAIDQEALTDDIVALAKQYERYGFRRVTALLDAVGWSVNHKRVERIRRCEGRKVPQRQPERSRLWLNDGWSIRLRKEYFGHVLPYDFVEMRTHDGRKFRILTIIDEASRECLALVVRASSATKMCWRLWPSCSLTGPHLHISDRTSAASSSPPQSTNGLGGSA